MKGKEVKAYAERMAEMMIKKEREERENSKPEVKAQMCRLAIMSRQCIHDCKNCEWNLEVEE